MAKLNNGILGGISGKVGNIVGSSWRNIDTIRSNPKGKKTGLIPLNSRNNASDLVLRPAL
jgi:hypothetical protein